MRVFFSNLGCKLNQAELEHLAREFRATGHTVAPSLTEADLHVVNTCTVTHVAARDSRKLARRGRRLNPAIRTVLTGCYVTAVPEEASGLAGVDLIVPNDEKDRLVEHVHRAFPEPGRPLGVAGSLPVPFVPLEFGNSRAPGQGRGRLQHALLFLRHPLHPWAPAQPANGRGGPRGRGTGRGWLPRGRHHRGPDLFLPRWRERSLRAGGGRPGEDRGRPPPAHLHCSLAVRPPAARTIFDRPAVPALSPISAERLRPNSESNASPVCTAGVRRAIEHHPRQAPGHRDHHRSDCRFSRRVGQGLRGQPRFLQSDELRASACLPFFATTRNRGRYSPTAGNRIPSYANAWRGCSRWPTPPSAVFGGRIWKPAPKSCGRGGRETAGTVLPTTTFGYTRTMTLTWPTVWDPHGSRPSPTMESAACSAP